MPHLALHAQRRRPVARARGRAAARRVRPVVRWPVLRARHARAQQPARDFPPSRFSHLACVRPGTACGLMQKRLPGCGCRQGWLSGTCAAHCLVIAALKLNELRVYGVGVRHAVRLTVAASRHVKKVTCRDGRARTSPSHPSGCVTGDMSRCPAIAIPAPRLTVLFLIPAARAALSAT